MAELATIARPYAEAAFSVALSSAPSSALPSSLPGSAAAGQSVAKNGTAAWLASLNALAHVVSHPGVALLATDPLVTRAQFLDVLVRAVGEPLPQPVLNFVEMLAENHRTVLLPQIAAQFEALKDAHEGLSDAVITSAFPLEGTALEELVASLEKKFGCKLKAQVVVDPSLIGGVSVAVGDEVLDTSVRARLAQMQAALTA
jgi:F-type H+-transporting ATPase subunit delta